MSENYQLFVLGEPTALKRHRRFKTKKGTIFNYDPSLTDKQDFIAAIQSKAPRQLIDKPVALKIWFYFSRPKNHFRTGRFEGALKQNVPLWHTKRPDIDNLLKFILDSLTGIFWRDDTLVCQTEVMKRYADKPRTEIYIDVLDVA